MARGIRGVIMQVPASALSLSMQQVWQVIVQQKDLDLPAHKVMVAHIRCKDIARSQLEAVTSDQAWQSLLNRATTGGEVLTTFKEDAALLVQSCLFGYDSDAMYFVDSVRNEQKTELEATLFSQLAAGYGVQTALLQKQLASEFRAELDCAAKNNKDSVAAIAARTKLEVVTKYEGFSPSSCST
jgi:protein SEY1